jgi:hypothetical protein
MLIRKASAPANRSARIISGLLDAGPSVARIFTLRERGVNISDTGFLCGLERPAHKGLRRPFKPPFDPPSNRLERRRALA